jgi:hypothetical protein
VTNASGVYTGSNIPVGTYTLTAFPGPDSNNAKTTVTGVNVPGPPTVTTKNLTLGDPPPPPPEGTTVTSIDTTSRGIPVAYWEDPLTLSTQGCTGGTATYQFVLEGHIVRQGSMAEGPAGTYTVTMAAVAPDHGDGEITTHIVCQGGDPAQDTDFGIYIDPSGAVRDTAGNPVEDATVTLLRSASPDGPFFALPGGSALMSPSNRSNPTTTGPDGRFGWDVVAGYYIVTAAKDGCRSAGDPAQLAARTGVLTIPPAVTNVDLRLDCSPPPTGTPPTATTSGPVIVPISAPAKKRSIVKLGSAKLVKGKVLAVKLTCAKTAVKACKGKLTAKLGKKLVGSARYAKLKRGKSAVVKVKLSKAGRALIKKAKGKKVRLALSATAADAKGAGATAKRTVAVRR